MLHEIYIFVCCNRSINFNVTMHIMKWETYVSWNIFNCVACGNVAQLQTLLSCFSLIQMERLQQLAWNIFPQCRWHRGRSDNLHFWSKGPIWFMKKYQNTKGLHCKSFGAKPLLWPGRKAKLTSIMIFLTQYWRMLRRVSYYLAIKMIRA